jgi:hypothetical protein
LAESTTRGELIHRAANQLEDPMMTRKKSLSSRLSRRYPTEAEIDASIAEFYSAHDRVAAIMGAALVEHALVGAIKACLEDGSDEGSLFYDDKAPFGTFYARIVSAKAFGMIDAVEEVELHVIRDVRNQFAHSVLCLDFSNAHIDSSCEKLKRLGWMETIGPPRAPISDARHLYESACFSLTSCIWARTTERTKKVADDGLSSKFGDIGDLIAASFKGGG